MTKAYLLGALHDATVRRITYRIGAKDLSYAKFLKEGVIALGHKAWIYKEGKNRNYYIVEFVKSVLDQVRLNSFEDKINYVRGYFDTDGGIARSQNVRYYLYFAQKNKNDLASVRNYLEQLGISCGVIHNPSKNKDANYFRFFVRATSYKKFAEIIGSWHPVKSQFLRVKI
ncbi:MAG: LAGLIDADG family homing endonuclease [Patescibacteria group bacterium]